MSKFNAKDALEDLGVSDEPNTPLVPSKAIQTLSNITSLNNPKVVPLEVMRRIVAMLQDDTISNKLIISSLLVCVSHLASFERSRMLLGDSTECIAALIPYIEMFSSPNIQSTALDALLNLINNYKKNQDKLAKKNLVGLIGIIQRESDKNRNKACQVLDQIVTHDPCAHSLVVNDAFMEASVMCLEIRHTELWAVRFFHRLSSHQECCKAIVEYATIDPLIDLLRKGLYIENNSYRELCLHVLRTLYSLTSLDNKTRASMIGAIPVLFQYIRMRSHLLTIGKVSEIAEQGIQNCEGRELCCKILANITEELPEEKSMYQVTKEDKDPLKKNKLRIINCHGLPVLCHLMKGIAQQSNLDPTMIPEAFIKHSAVVQRLAVKIVANIAKVEENTLKMLGLKVFEEYKDGEDEEEPEEEVNLEPPPELLEEIAAIESASSQEPDSTEVSTSGSAPPPPPTKASPQDGSAPPPPPSKSTVTSTAPVTSTDGTAPAPETKPTEQGETPVKKETDTHTLEQLHEQMKDGLFLTNLLLDLLVGSHDEEMKTNAISAISAFAIHVNCATQLVDLGVIARLLEMIQSKVESIVIATLFASMNVHDAFQKKLYSIGGLTPLVNLLNSKTSQQEIEAGLIAIGPFVKTPNGRMILKKEGVLIRLKELLKSTDNNERVASLAREIVRTLKSESDAIMHALTGENTGDEVMSYDEIFRIAKDLVSVSQRAIQKMMNRRHVRLHVNWRKVEKLKEFANEAMGLLSRDALWDELAIAVEIFINCVQGNLLAFQNNVAIIIVEVNDNEETKNFCEVKIDNLIMRYRIAQNGTLLTPKSLAAEISMEIYGHDVTNYNGQEEERDEAYQLAVEALRKTTSDSRLPLIGDLNILYFHVEQAENLYRASFHENQGIIASKNAVLDPDELFIKGWKIVKINKDGLKQERLLLLTDRSYYTVHFDYNIRKIDYKHCKQHNLEDYFLIDIGRLRDSKDDDPELDWSRPHALNLVTNEKAHSKSKHEAEEDEEFEMQAATAEDDDEDLLTSTDILTGTANSGSSGSTDDELTQSIAAVKDVEQAIMGGEEEEEEITKITRPSTKGKYSSVFVAPGTVPPNKQQSYMEEIALCFYAAAAAYRREEVLPPFKRPVRKPGSKSLKAKLYNTFFGSKTTEIIASPPPKSSSGNMRTTLPTEPTSNQNEYESSSPSPRGGNTTPRSATTEKQGIRDIFAKRRSLKP